MSNILIINGAKKFAHSNGQLNDTLTEVADGTLRDLGHDVRIVRADSDYDVKAEVQNFLWADVVIWQMPGWWMGAPWTVKKYIDDVFTEGHGTLYASDGRTRKDPSKKYGSGGLVQGKKYMLSLTWNAPMEAFTEKDQFFHGVGVDGLFLAGRAIKALADARQGLCADARAVVAYAKFTRIKDDVDLASGGAIAHGVIQKIAHQQAQQQRLAGARDVFRVQVQA